ARLARMLGADLETSTEEERLTLAHRAARGQIMLLLGALERVVARLSGPPRTVVVSGSGEFLARLLLKEQKSFPPCRVVSLASELGPALSASGCAFAVAVLAEELADDRG